MDFQCTQVIEDDGISESSGYNSTSSTDDKVQIGTLEIGGDKHVIRKGLTKVGRHPACEICLQDNTVSKIHAEIEANGKNVFICDLQSSNKTRMNDAVLLPKRFFEVADGASLKFGIVEARFFLKRPNDLSVLAPETPEPGLRSRHDTSGNDSLIEATPNVKDGASFRLPSLPPQKRGRISFPRHNEDSNVPEDDIRNAETQIGSLEDISDIDTQVSTLQNDTSDIQMMETQLSESNLSHRQKSLNQQNEVNIRDMETQCMNNSDTFDGCPSPKRSTAGHVPSGQISIHDADTQVFNPEEGSSGTADVSGMTRGGRSKKQISEQKVGIEDIDTQVFPAEVVDDDIKETPHPRNNSQNAEGTTNSALQHPENVPKSAFVPVRSDSISQSSIHDLQTQRPDADYDVETPAKLLSQFEKDRRTLHSEMFGSGAVQSDEEAADIYDLPTQKSVAKPEVESCQKQPSQSRTKICVSRGSSSSPDLLNGANHVIIAESDVETDEDGVFEELKRKSDDHSSKLEVQSAKEADDQMAQSNEDKQGGKNCVIDDSDDDNNRDNLRNESDELITENVENEKEDKIDLNESKDGERIIDDSGSDTDFDVDNAKGINGKKSEIDLENHDLSPSRFPPFIVEDSDETDVERAPKPINEDHKSTKNDLKNSQSSKDATKSESVMKQINSDNSGDDTYYEEAASIRQKVRKSPKKQLKNSKASKNFRSCKSDSGERQPVSGGSENEADLEEDASPQKKLSQSSTDLEKSSKADLKSSKSGSRNRKLGSAGSNDDTDSTQERNRRKKLLKSSKNNFKNCKSSKSRLSKSETKAVSEASGDETDFEEDLSPRKKFRKSKNDPKKSKSFNNDSRSSKSGHKMGKPGDSDDTDFEEDSNSKNPSRSSKNNFKNSKSKNDSRSSRSTPRVGKADSGGSDDEPDTRKSSSLQKKPTKSSNTILLLSDSSGESKPSESTQKSSISIRSASWDTKVALSLLASDDDTDPDDKFKSSKLTSRPSKNQFKNSKSSKSLRVTSAKKNSSDLLDKTSETVQLTASDSDTDHKEGKSSRNGLKNSRSSKSKSRTVNTSSGNGDIEKPPKSSKNGFKNSKSSKSSSTLESDNDELVKKPSSRKLAKSESIDKSKNVGRNPLEGIDTTGIPAHVLQIMKSSVQGRKSSENGPDDEDDPYSAPTQVIQMNRSRNSRKSRKQDSDDDLPTQKIDMNLMRNRETLDIDELAPTQVIPGASRESDDDDMAATQKIDVRAFTAEKRGIYENAEFVDDLAPTQVIHEEQGQDRDSGSSLGRPQYQSDDDLAPTQVMDVEKIGSEIGERSNLGKRGFGEIELSDDLRTKRMRFEDLNDSEMTQMIDMRPPRSSTRLQKSTPKPSKLQNLTNSTPKNPSRIPRESLNISPLPPKDPEDSPSNPQQRTPKSSNSEENIFESPTSTPSVSSPRKKRKFNLSLKARKETEGKESGFNSRTTSTEKSLEKTGKNSETEDSITQNLDSMFGGEDKEAAVDPEGPLMTQQLVEILQPSQSPPKTPKSRRNATRARKTKKTPQKSRRKALGAPEEILEIDNHAESNVKKPTRSRNVGESGLGSSEEEIGFPGFEKATSAISSRKGSRNPRTATGKSTVRKGSKDPQELTKPSASKNISDTSSKILKPLVEPSTSKCIPENTGRSPRSSKIERSEFPKVAIMKLTRTSAKETFESSEDEDFECINAMADGFLTSSAAGKSPRAKKASVKKAVKMEEKIEEPAKIQESSRRGRGGRKTVAKSKEEALEKIVENHTEKKNEKENAVQEEAILKTPTKRGRKKAEKVEVQKELVEEVKVTEPVRKRGRPKKGNEDEESRIKRAKRDESAIFSPSPASQEVIGILQGAEESGEEKRVEGAKNSSLKGKGKGKKSEERVQGLDESPAKSVRSRSYVEDGKPQCVLFTGVKDAEEKNAYKVEVLGGTVTSDPLNATILVTDKVRRTVKFLCAVSKGIPIVSIAWMEGSIAAKQFLDPNKFILHDPIAESRFRFTLRKSLSRARDKKLLDNRTIVLTSKLVGPTIAELKSMVQMAGGRPLIRAPAKWLDQTIIVTCNEDLPRVKKMIAKVHFVKVYVVDIEFLMSGMLRQQLDYDEFAFKV